MVNHSNFGEFAYRREDWKLVYRLSEQNLEASRGKRTIAELYDLSKDIGETNDLALERPEKATELTAELDELIRSGASRPGAIGRNDCEVRFDVTQQFRWIEY